MRTICQPLRFPSTNKFRDIRLPLELTQRTTSHPQRQFPVPNEFPGKRDRSGRMADEENTLMFVREFTLDFLD